MIIRIMVTVSILCLVFFPVKAQNITLSYLESEEDFINPERGFYIPTGTKSSNFILLDEKRLITYRDQLQQPSGATYKVNVSLLYRGYELDTFTNRPLSADFLLNLQKDFDAVRAAGLKIILRFAYTNSTKSGTCSDEYKICPPYGDAPVAMVLKHVEQLKPLLRANADIIAVMQEGFIGIWGENYFTDYFGDASTNGLGVVADSSWLDRNKLLKQLLNALPEDRMVQVRTPQIKQRFVYGPRASAGSAPLTLQEALTKTDKARVGFHNDSFLASEDDYGTFYDYGNSVQKRDTANQRLRNYFEADSRYVAVGGETCDDAYSPQNDCAPFGHAEKEMAAMHYSYLNAAYNNQVNNDWDSLGCMRRIKQKLGYRLVLQQAILPSAITANKEFSVQIELDNKGFAAPFNPRPVRLILRNKTTGKRIRLHFRTNIKQWFTGKVMLKQVFKLPPGTEKGAYEVLLDLPDGYKRLQNNPAYSIRLGNKDLWESSTGFNALNHLLQVK